MQQMGEIEMNELLQKGYSSFECSRPSPTAKAFPYDWFGVLIYTICEGISLVLLLVKGYCTICQWVTLVVWRPLLKHIIIVMCISF